MNVVTKPFEPEVLIETLRRYIPRRASRSETNALQPSAALTQSSERDGRPTADGVDASKARQNLADDHELFCNLTLKLEELLGHFPPQLLEEMARARRGIAQVQAFDGRTALERRRHCEQTNVTYSHLSQH